MSDCETARRLGRERTAALEHLAILEAALRDVVESSGSTTGDDEHDPEGATIAFERAQVAALAAQARQRIGDVDAALARLGSGAYGICARCGQAIAPDRLAARPAAALCVACASTAR